MWRDEKLNSQLLLKIMACLGGAATALVILLRVWLAPAVADWETGRISPNYLTIGLMLLCLVVLFVLGRLIGMTRREVGGRPAVWVAVCALACGVAIAANGLWDVLTYFHVIPSSTVQFGAIYLLEHLFGLGSGAALIRFGLALMSEGSTRRGIAQWSVLAPVVWLWLRLVSYEMSYASMVRLEDNFFGFMMFVLELLFLFRFARYMSGIGRISAGSMMFYSMATAMFALSAPVVRVAMYLLGEGASFAAYHLAGPVDFALGLFALTFGVSLLFGTPVAQELPVSAPAPDVSAVKDEADEDVSAASVATDLLLDFVEEDEPEIEG